MQSDFIQALQQRWDSFADNYANIQQNTFLIGLPLLNLLKIQNSKSILDAGCGLGINDTHILSVKQQNCRFEACDLSLEMVNRTAQRVQKYLGNASFQDANFNVSQGNVENLTQFKDQTFDTYFSNLVLQLTENPQQQLAEANRVLQPGGKLGLSVWGRKENSDVMVTQNQILEDLQIVPARNPRNFHLGDKVKLKEMLIQAGFTNIIMWYQSNPFDFITIEDHFKSFDPPTLERINQLPIETKEILHQQYNKKITEKIQIQGEPFYLETLMVVAQKQ